MYSVKISVERFAKKACEGVRGLSTTILTPKHARPVFAAAYFEMRKRAP